MNFDESSERMEVDEEIPTGSLNKCITNYKVIFLFRSQAFTTFFQQRSLSSSDSVIIVDDPSMVTLLQRW